MNINNNSNGEIREWNDEEKIKLASKLKSLSLPVPDRVIVDERKEWEMNSQHRKNGFLTISLKVNRVAIERYFFPGS